MQYACEAFAMHQSPGRARGTYYPIEVQKKPFGSQQSRAERSQLETPGTKKKNSSDSCPEARGLRVAVLCAQHTRETGNDKRIIRKSFDHCEVEWSSPVCCCGKSAYQTLGDACTERGTYPMTPTQQSVEKHKKVVRCCG